MVCRRDGCGRVGGTRIREGVEELCQKAGAGEAPTVEENKCNSGVYFSLAAYTTVTKRQFTIHLFLISQFQNPLCLLNLFLVHCLLFCQNFSNTQLLKFAKRIGEILLA